MKRRGIILLIFLVIAFIVSARYNGAIRSLFLDFINPIKSLYLNITNLSDSYIQQQKSIVKLKEENAKLNKLLIEQSNYIDQFGKIYRLLPSLAKKPYRSIYLVDTISYIKLNRLNELMLTYPKNIKLKSDKLYGLMQNDVASGVAREIDGKLYGYLLSHPKCTFSVTIGDSYASGIAQGNDNNGMIVKYIPRWSNIKIGDEVKTSGLDNIFFPNTPVGKVTDIKVLDRYKLATIEISANLAKPSIFFLISDATPYLTTSYVPKTSFPNKVYPFVQVEKDSDNQDISQTKENIVEPQEVDEDKYLEFLNKNLILNKPFEFEENSSNN